MNWLDNRYLVIFALSAWLMLTLWSLIKDLRFYKNNGWNFDEQGGATYIGPAADGFEADRPFDPRIRIFILYPACVVIAATGVLVTVQSLWETANA